jgi:sec-independent protein translocase protein TatB
MFDLGWTELLIIGVVALIVVGPKDLPKMFRTLGQMMGKARGMAREFQRAMDAAADEAGVKDIARDLRNTASGKDVKDAMGFDELDRDMRAMGRPDQWGKSPSPKPGKAASGAKPDPAAAPPADPVDDHEAAVRADDRAQTARAAHAAAMDEERRKRAERAAEARARAAEIRARRESAAAPAAEAAPAPAARKASARKPAAGKAAKPHATDAD